MTFIKHYDGWKTINAASHLTGKLPNTTALQRARQTLLYGVQNYGCGQLMQYEGCAGTSYNGSTTANFYIIFPCIEPPGDDGKVRIGVDLQLYRQHVSTPFSTSFDAVTASSRSVVTGTSQTQYEQPGGIRLFDSAEVDWNNNQQGSSGAYYGYTKYAITGTPKVAALSAFSVPRLTEDYQGDTAPTVSGTTVFDQQFGVKADAFNVGQPLLGAEDPAAIGAYYSVNGSVSAMCQHQTAVNAQIPSLMASTAPCVFQWGHPSGCLHVGGGGSQAWETMFGSPKIPFTVGSLRTVTHKLRGRDLDGGATKRLDLAVVALWDTDAACRLTTTSDTSSTLSFSGSNTVTPALVVFPDAVEYDPTGDTVYLENYVSTTIGVEYQAIALFERSYGADL
jgi:hypothetical protein